MVRYWLAVVHFSFFLFVYIHSFSGSFENRVLIFSIFNLPRTFSELFASSWKSYIYLLLTIFIQRILHIIYKNILSFFFFFGTKLRSLESLFLNIDLVRTSLYRSFCQRRRVFTENIPAQQIRPDTDLSGAMFGKMATSLRIELLWSRGDSLKLNLIKGFNTRRIYMNLDVFID